MKTLTRVLLVVSMCFLFSCEEEQSNCWTCRMQQTKDDVLYFNFCDKTEEEIRAYEDMHTFVHNYNGEFWHQTTVCTRNK